MASEEQAIQVDGLAFQITPRGVEAMLRGEGIEIRLSGLNLRVSEAALNAILARLAPEGTAATLQAKLSPEGVAIDRREGEKLVHLDVAVSELRLHIVDGELRIESAT